MAQKDFLTGKKQIHFESIQHCLVPRSQFFTSEQKKQSLSLINHLLDDKPSTVKFQLSLFLFIINLISLLFGFKTFKNLAVHQQNRVINFLFDAPIPLIRKGFWGLNTLAKFGVYGQPSFYPTIGYHLKEIPHD